MYIPKHFEEHNRDRIIDLARDYAFATLVTVKDGAPLANHYPLLIEDSDNLTILGHMAKSNEQWKHFDGKHESLVIFQGPHTYISPSNYEGPGVPTWNYSVVHMIGKGRVIDDKKTLINIIESLTEKYEASQEPPWTLQYPDSMLDAIVGFELVVERIEAKYKLSQNRSETERKIIINNLGKSTNDNARRIAKMMSDIR